MPSPLRRSTPILALLAAGVAVLTSCAPQEPPPPPPPRALTVYPERGQTQAQQNRDSSQCQNTASAQANSSESWAQIFAACMSGRGYGVR